MLVALVVFYSYPVLIAIAAPRWGWSGWTAAGDRPGRRVPGLHDRGPGRRGDRRGRAAGRRAGAHRRALVLTARHFAVPAGAVHDPRSAAVLYLGTATSLTGSLGHRCSTLARSVTTLTLGPGTRRLLISRRGRLLGVSNAGPSGRGNVTGAAFVSLLLSSKRTVGSCGPATVADPLLSTITGAAATSRPAIGHAPSIGRSTAGQARPGPRRAAAIRSQFGVGRGRSAVRIPAQLAGGAHRRAETYVRACPWSSAPRPTTSAATCYFRRPRPRGGCAC